MHTGIHCLNKYSAALLFLLNQTENITRVFDLNNHYWKYLKGYVDSPGWQKTFKPQIALNRAQIFIQKISNSAGLKISNDTGFAFKKQQQQQNSQEHLKMSSTFLHNCKVYYVYNMVTVKLPYFNC